jgi:ubiquinone/menaquinone biosynthesis C-methylase UbiE
MSSDRPPVRDFSLVTELPDSPATRVQLARLVQRYGFAAEHVARRRTLEVACGAGIGLGYLARSAASLVGGDYTEPLLQQARAHYGARVPLVRLDAQALPFGDASFDAVLVFEAIYYFPNLERFLAEARRVLAAGGLIIISSVNPEWTGFSPSSFSTRYVPLSELTALLRAAGFQMVGCYGGFPTHEGTAVDRLIEHGRRVAASLHLIPDTLGARAWLKRVFYGPTAKLVPEVTPETSTAPPVAPIGADRSDRSHQILYVVARRD